MRKLLLAGGIGIALVGAFVAGRKTGATEEEHYVPRRGWILTETAQRTPDGGVLMIGDSLTERSGFATHCGMPVFNAGVSMAKAQDMRWAARTLAEELTPDLTVVALGTNDVLMETPIADFRREMTEMLAELPKPMTLVSVPELPENKDAAQPYNAVIAELARQPGIKLVEPIAYETSDGVHQSPAGAQTWRAAIEASCQ